MIFKNKKVTVMGLGLYENGSGISATKFLLSQGAKVTVTDLKTKEELAQQIKRLGIGAKKITWVLGRHRQEDFKNVDLIVKNPGVPSTSLYLKVAKKERIPIETDISIFFQLVGRKRIIGITGTRGKSTTTSLIYEIMKTVDRNAVLGGNITSSPLSQMARVKKGGMVVLELSSWMLESLKPHSLSPYISVVTNIYPDHLNTYRNLAHYAKTKENIFNSQNIQDIVILNRDNKFTREMGKRVPSQRFWFSLKEFKWENGCFIKVGWIYFRRDGKEVKVLSVKDINLLGEHNLSNVLSAICVAMVYGVSVTNIKQVVKNFKGIPNRLEFLKEVKGVKYYNDTTSTTPDATMAALRALKDKSKKIVLIMGGSDKGLQYNELLKEIKKHCKVVILLPGSGTNHLKLKIKDLRLKIVETDNMTNAVGVAQGLSQRGDIVLLSPAFASFGLFKNEFDRGEQFRDVVDKLTVCHCEESAGRRGNDKLNR